MAETPALHTTDTGEMDIRWTEEAVKDAAATEESNADVSATDDLEAYFSALLREKTTLPAEITAGNYVTMNLDDRGVPRTIYPSRLVLLFLTLESTWPMSLWESILDINYQYLRLGRWIAKHNLMPAPADDASWLDEFEDRLDNSYKSFTAWNNSTEEEKKRMTGPAVLGEFYSMSSTQFQQHRAYIIKTILDEKPWNKDLPDFPGGLALLLELNNIFMFSANYTAEFFSQVFEADEPPLKTAYGGATEVSSELTALRELFEEGDDFLDRVELESKFSRHAVVFPTGGEKQRRHVGHLINQKVRARVKRTPNFRVRDVTRTLPNGSIPYWIRLVGMIAVHILTITIVIGLQWNVLLSLMICILIDMVFNFLYQGLRRDITKLPASAFRVDPLVQILAMHFCVWVWATFSILDFTFFAIVLTFCLGINYGLMQYGGRSYPFHAYNILSLHFAVFGHHLRYSWLWLAITSSIFTVAHWIFVWAVMTTYVEHRNLKDLKPIYDVPAIYFFLAIISPLMGEGITTFWHRITAPVLYFLGWEFIATQIGWRQSGSTDFIRPILNMLVMNVAETYFGFSVTQAWLLLMAFEGYGLVSNLGSAMRM